MSFLGQVNTLCFGIKTRILNIGIQNLKVECI